MPARKNKCSDEELLVHDGIGIWLASRRLEQGRFAWPNEELCAWIVLREGQKATEAEIRAFCDGQIAHYKIPKYIRFVESFPMTVTGKVQKYLIRQKMKDELALEEAKTA